MSTRPAITTWLSPAVGAIVFGIATPVAIYAVGPYAGTALVIGGILAAVTLPLGLEQLLRSIGTLRGELRWWHGLWFLLFASAFVFRVRDADSIRESPLDAWALYRVGACGLVGFILAARLLLGKTRWLAPMFRPLLVGLAVFSCVSMLSALWSVYPAWSFYRSLEYFIDVALLSAILTQVKAPDRFKSLFDWYWLLTGALMLAIGAGVLIWPDKAVARGMGLLGFQIEGVLPQVSANSVGGTAATLGIIAFARLQRRGTSRILYLIVFAASLVALTFSQTRSAIVGWLAGVSLVMLTGKRFRSMVLVMWVAILLVLFTGAGDVFLTYFQRGQNADDFRGLTGRVDWWTYGWHKYIERPWSGYGAYTARFVVMAEVGFSDTSSIHNTYLELLFGTGPAGLLAILYVLVGTWVSLIRALRGSPEGSVERQLTVESLGLLGLLTAGTFFSTGLAWHPDQGFLLCVGYAELLRRRRAASRATASRSRVLHQTPDVPGYALPARRRAKKPCAKCEY